MRTEERRTVSLRMQAGEMLAAGHSISHIARELGISDTTVRKYRSIVQAGGLAALRDLSVGGRRSVLDARARTSLADALTRGPRQCGIDAERWTIGAVASLIRRDFGLSLSRVYVRQIIIDLGFGDRLRTIAFSSMPGNPRKLDEEGLAWLCAIVKRAPAEYGIDTAHWTNARLRLAVKARYGVTYSRSHMWKLISDSGLSAFVSRGSGSRVKR
jgi:transposase